MVALGRETVFIIWSNNCSLVRFKAFNGRSKKVRRSKCRRLFAGRKRLENFRHRGIVGLKLYHHPYVGQIDP
jgi:hypothetical protein